MGAWEEVKAEEERRAAAEAEVFRHKTRSTDIASEEQVGRGRCWAGFLTGHLAALLRTARSASSAKGCCPRALSARPAECEQALHQLSLPDLPGLRFASAPCSAQEDEEDYQRQFPDQFSAHFADLAPDEGPDTLAGDSEAAVAAAAAAAAGPLPEEEALGAAALSARELVVGEVLGDLVAVHAAAFGPEGAAGEAVAIDFLRSYELGVELLRAAGLVLPASLDGATAGGHLYAAACRFRQLAQAPPAAGAAAKAGVDMQAPCVEEAVLVQAPLLALRGRLRELLEEWPDHPGLLQASC